MTETPRVEAFIRTKQDSVLARAMDTVATTPNTELGAQAHRLVGTLATFGLDEAADALRALDTRLAAPDPASAEEISALRDDAVRTLADVIASRDET